MYIDRVTVYPEGSTICVTLGKSSLYIAMPKEVRDAIVTICSAETARFMANMNVSSTDVLDESLRYMNQPSQPSQRNLFDPE